MSSRPAWSTPLARPVKAKGIRAFRTLDDVRAFILDRLEPERHRHTTWQVVGQGLLKAAADPTQVLSVTVALEMTLAMEGRWDKPR